MKRLTYLLSLSLFFLSFLISAQEPISLPGPITVCPAGEFAGHHHVPTPHWIQEKIAASRQAKAAGISCGSIDVTYVGFTPEAEAAFQAAVDIWEASLQTNVTIEVLATWTVLEEGVLGSAGPNSIWTNFSGAPEAHYYPSALADQLQGSNLEPGEPDINANFNSDFDWYFGTDGNPPNDQYDLLSVVLHELGHGLGFISTREYNAGEGTLGDGGIPYTYATYLTLGPGGELLVDISNSTELGDAFTSDNVYTNSPGATEALSGVFPRHYAPADYAGGSSLSHWNESTYGPGNINSLMTPQLGPGEAILDPGPITLGLFEDIGWILCEGSGGDCNANDLVLTGAASICPGETTEVDVQSPNLIPDGGGAGVRFNNNDDINIILFGVSFPYSFDNDLNGVLSANDFDPFAGEFDLTVFVYTDPDNPGSSICDESVNPVVVDFLTSNDVGCSGNECIAEDLSLTGPSSICPGETTSVELVAPNSIPEGGGQGVRFNNGDDVNIVLFGVSFPYSFDNDLNGLLSANDFDPFTGEFELNTFVYSDENDAGGSICDESSVFAIVNFLPENDPDCNVISCVAENLNLTGPEAICPGESTTVDLVAPNSIPGGGGQGIRFNNGVDVNITLFGIDFPYSFDNDLNGVLSANDFDPFVGNFELNTFVYTDPDDVQNTICSESTETVNINFREANDPECTPCEAANLALLGPSEICPGETTEVGLATPISIPAGGGAGIRFNNGVDVNITLFGIDFPYSFDNDLNGVLSANDFDPFVGEFELNTFVYTDPDDVQNTICDESSQTLTIDFREAGDPECTPCQAENLIVSGPSEICPEETTAVALSAPNSVPPGGGAGIRFNNGVDVNITLFGIEFPYSFDNDLNGVLSANDFDPFVGAFELNTFVYTDPDDVQNTICSESTETVSINFLTDTDIPCFVACNAGDLEPEDGNTLCPGFSSSILNTDGLNGVSYPSEGGYRLRVEIEGSTYFMETDDNQYGFVIDNDLFGVVSGQGNDPLVGVASLTTETFEDSNDPGGTICDTSEELSFEFLAENDPGCVTSVAEFIGSSGWNLFPNPSSDRISIQFEGTETGNLQVHLVDLQGRIIKAKNTAVSTGKINIELDVNDIVAGYYRVILSMNGSRDSKPLVVARE